MTLPFDIDWRSFWLGFALFAVLGFIFFISGVWKPPSPFKPQTIVLTTKKTPWQVVMAWAGSRLILLAVGVAFAVVGILTFMDVQLTELWWLVVVAVISFLAGVLIRSLYG